MMTKKVLIITYFFPPRPAVASLRLGGLAKYLPEFGWEPTILTAKLPSPPENRYAVIETPDSDLLVEWKQLLGLSTDKTFREQLGQDKKEDTAVDVILNTAREIVAYPDYQKNWYWYALPAARDLLKEGDFNAIFSSAGPATAHIIAHELKKEFDIPWIADFRDLWTQHHNYSFSKYRKFFERRLEIRTLSNADLVTTVSEPLAEKLGKLHSRRVHVVPNGFDPDLISRDHAISPKFSIHYTGRVYRGKMDPEPLFTVVQKMINEHKIIPSDIEIHFWGGTETWVKDLARLHNVDDIVNIHGYIPHNQAIEIQRQGQVLLLLAWNDPREEGLLSGKIYEYLAARRPILAIGNYQKVIHDLLEETHAGIMADTNQIIENTLMENYLCYKKSGVVPFTGIESQILQYSHREMAKKFAELLNLTKS